MLDSNECVFEFFVFEYSLTNNSQRERDFNEAYKFHNYEQD